MATVTTLEALLAAYDADSSDAVTALALADFYEESGDQDASDAVRWLVSNGKRPLSHKFPGRNGHLYIRSSLGLLPDDVAWVNHAMTASDYEFFSCDTDPGKLPDILWDTLGGYIQDGRPSYYKTYRSPSLALRAFINAWTDDIWRHESVNGI